MSDAVVCHGARLFGQVLPPFVLAEGGLMIVKTHTVARQAEYARLLFCEALCETVVVEGIEVFQPFEVVHPYLRADAWGYKVAAQVLRPRHNIPFMVDYFFRSRSTKWRTDKMISNIEKWTKDGKSLVFSFMALGGAEFTPRPGSCDGPTAARHRDRDRGRHDQLLGGGIHARGNNHRLRGGGC